MAFDNKTVEKLEQVRGWVAFERMTVLFRCRVEKPMLKKVNTVTQRLGTDTGEVFRIFLAEIARTGRVPVRLALEPDAAPVLSWKQRSKTLESFYDESKTW
jgi:antitoxin component of RelBE/YafQ-DinJ toxin-antitoxin module